jgi:hypothetical protein
MEVGKYNKVLCANDKGGETFTFDEKNTRSGEGYLPLANEPIGTEFVREWLRLGRTVGRQDGSTPMAALPRDRDLHVGPAVGSVP